MLLPVLLITIFLVIKLAYVQSGFVFFSLKPGFSWKVDKKDLKDFKIEVSEIIGEDPKIILILSPKFKQTPVFVGFGVDERLYYSEWGSFRDWQVLKVYINMDVWNKHSSQEKADRLPRFIRLSILEHWKLNLSDEDKRYFNFFIGSGPKVKIVKYLPF